MAKFANCSSSPPERETCHSKTYPGQSAKQRTQKRFGHGTNQRQGIGPLSLALSW
jgi:hypothetical protein